MKFIQSLLINSKDRQSGQTLNNFTLNKLLNIHGCDFWAVDRIFMVNNIYPINGNNNQMAIIAGGNSGTITVSAGNYNINQLLTEVVNQLNGLGHPTVYASTYNNITNKVTISSTVGNITLISGNLALVLGFTSPQTGSALTITSTNPVNIMYSQYLNFASSYLMKYNRPNLKTDLLQPYFYSLNNNYFNFGASVKEVVRNLKYIRWSRDETINNFDIQVYDDFGQLADMNNSEFIIIINFYRNE